MKEDIARGIITQVIDDAKVNGDKDTDEYLETIIDALELEAWRANPYAELARGIGRVEELMKALKGAGGDEVGIARVEAGLSILSDVGHEVTITAALYLDDPYASEVTGKAWGPTRRGEEVPER